jgi:hypothetical protein
MPTKKVRGRMHLLSDHSDIYSSIWSRVFLSILTLVFAFTTASSQDLPKRIRGYKVHQEIIRVEQISGDKGAEDPHEPTVTIGDPILQKVSLTGVTFALPAEIFSPMQSGRVEFITFNDFRVNDIPIKVEEYRKQFEFRRNERMLLPEPAMIFLPTERLLQGVWYELRERKSAWRVTGRLFVFGKFRRFGLYHKRVVPIDIDILIANPLRNGENNF